MVPEDMSEENSTINAGTLRAESAAVPPDWMKFPTLSAAFEPAPSQTIAYLATKQQEYQSLETTGAANDRVRARLIAAGYGRTCALLLELEKARTEFLNQQETDSVETR
jgi:hypothetical protein